MDEFTQHKGSIQAYVDNLFRFQTEQSPRPRCWRVFDGEQMCTGKSSQADFVVAIGHILIIETQFLIEQDENEQFSAGLTPNGWKFPAQLRIKKASDASPEVTYTMVSRVYQNEQHFRVRFASGAPGSNLAIYDYDGMQNSGRPQLLDRATLKSSMEGTDQAINRQNRPFPQGYRTQSVVYVLEGGPKVQTAFFKSRRTLARQFHDIDIRFDYDTGSAASAISISQIFTKRLTGSDIFWRTGAETHNLEELEMSSGT